MFSKQSLTKCIYTLFVRYILVLIYMSDANKNTQYYSYNISNVHVTQNM